MCFFLICLVLLCFYKLSVKSVLRTFLKIESLATVNCKMPLTLLACTLQTSSLALNGLGKNSLCIPSRVYFYFKSKIKIDCVKFFCSLFNKRKSEGKKKKGVAYFVCLKRKVLTGCKRCGMSKIDILVHSLYIGFTLMQLH